MSEVTQTLQWTSPYSSMAILGWLIVASVVMALIRWGWGQGHLGKRWAIWILRAASLGLAFAILLGPTWTERFSAEIQHPKLLFLFDGSASMKLGADTSRWQDAIDFVSKGIGKTPTQNQGDTQWFRFGHRLAPFSNEPQSKGLSPLGPRLSESLTNPVSNSLRESPKIAEPDATDSRLADSLRELSSRIDTKKTAGIVLLSDGRVREGESVEQLASLVGKRSIPIHVVPLGTSEGVGDLAIVSMVKPERVRKFSEIEIQVFLRSFGLAGRPTTVRIVDANAIAGKQTTLSSVPIVLTGNAQSVSLPVNIADQPRNLKVIVDPVPGELSTRNNELEVAITLDRTRIRVLYIEGSVDRRSILDAVQETLFGTSREPTPADANRFTVPRALREDTDLDVAFFMSQGGRLAPTRVRETESLNSSSAFPDTRSELFSFDCIVFSNVGPDVLEPSQQELIAQWIEGRGAGMIVTGSDAVATQRWRDTNLFRTLPVTSDSGERIETATPITMASNSLRHPVWRLLNEEEANQQLLRSIPSLNVGVRGLKIKPGAEVLAQSDDGQQEPMIVSHRVGRGRVLLSAAALGGDNGSPLHSAWGTDGRRNASKLWKNLVYWATEGSSIGRRRITVEADKQFYRPGETINFKAVAYDESARKTTNYRLWAMFEPLSIDDRSLFAPALWPDSVRRDSGETSPRIAWGEELPVPVQNEGEFYSLSMNLSDSSDSALGGMRMEITAYEGKETNSGSNHGTQVDSMSLELYILSDPFEQQNPLPNHDLLARVAKLSGGEVLKNPDQLARLMESRPTIETTPLETQKPAWSRWWVFALLCGLVCSEWLVRRLQGLA